ncbi:AEC family transporter [Desertibacillus haloalkaliphilus]|uniref:AEC family transporter n=1 Tax=Desertibacillus haloalkaliphilus TaxID=1328930 RepID=UPI001C259E32|nr:AEC family transporter [Desertibacillus haloalkaliphilus]MBU8906951.1 AEC family transporter [Desertibacillus haloalkaliphilus]
MNIFIEVVLPVLLVFFIGFLVQKWKKIDIKPVSTVAIYVMMPCLVLRTFYTAEIDIQYVYMVVFSALLLFAMIVINKMYVMIRRYPPKVEDGLILSTAFMNSGNYGAPIILFAYGTAGFDFAVSFMVLQSIIMNFFGVYYAARGGAGIALAIRAVFKMPATYAVIVALLMKATPVGIPENLFMTVDIIAEATIPTVMIILGMQLALIKWGNFDWEKVSFGVIARLFASPAIAYAITLMLPLDPLLAKVLIVSAAMPSAATIVMYAVQFDSEPKLVSSITLITTLISVVTLTVLLMILG